MSKKTLALIVVLLLASVALVILAINPRNAKIAQQLAPSPSPTPAAHTMMAIMPNPVILSTSGLGRADIEINPNGNMITTVQIELKYDPNVLTNVDITPGSFFTSPTKLKRIDPTTGRITFALWIDPKQNAVTRQGTVATLTFSKKFGVAPTIQSTNISFVPKTQATAQGVPDSVIASLTGASVILSAPKSGLQTTGTQTSPVIPSKTVVMPTTSTRSAK